MKPSDIESHIRKLDDVQDLKVLQHFLAKEIELREAALIALICSEVKATLLQKAKQAGISIERIGNPFEPSAGTGKPKDEGNGERKVAPKYVNPGNSQETWSGRGRFPVWLKKKLNAGHHKSEFLSSGTAS